MNKYNNTICAISTPAGNGAIAVIRLSGSNALQICDKIFTPQNKKIKITKAQPNTIHYGNIIYNNEIIDDVLISVFKAPKSYTGEDSIEISCHGSIYIQKKILEILINEGADFAKPGEFTQRAFLNGKLDLSQAEGVADVIASESEASHRIAIQQMKGGFSAKLNNLRKLLIHFVSLIELENDFSEEDVEFADKTQLRDIIDDVDKHLSELIKSFKYGNVIKNGIPIAIVGRPNSGKSTLLNTLLNENRAIVSEIAGTTRDTIEEIVNIEGVQCRFIDTAGLRETTDEIEKIGVEKAIEKIDNSTIYLYLFDISTVSLQSVKEDLKQLNNNIQRIVIANKTDLVSDKIINEFENSKLDFLFISAKQNKSIDLLKETLLKNINESITNPNGIVVTNIRHYEALIKAQQSIHETKDGIENEMPTDLIALDIRNAIHHIGEITGEISNNEILGNIFGSFCIGK